MKLTNLLLAITIFASLSCQVYNSASRDKLIYGSGVDANSNFGKALSVLVDRCITCHADFGSLTTEAAWVASGRVVAGNISQSSIYYRLNGAGLGVGSEDMPQNSLLSSSEITLIRNWILGM